MNLLARLRALIDPPLPPIDYVDPTADPPSLDTVDGALADRLLAGIDDIDWTALEHAYGPATTTPAYLRALLATDPTVRDDAVEHLFSAITHQGTVYAATAAAAPYLLAILGDDAGRPVRAYLLAVIGAIAEGTSYHDVHAPYYRADERESAEFQARIAAELADTAACRRAVLSGFDLVRGFVEDPDPEVRREAASTLVHLAAMPEATADQRSATAGLAAIDDEDDED